MSFNLNEHMGGVTCIGDGILNGTFLDANSRSPFAYRVVSTKPPQKKIKINYVDGTSYQYKGNNVEVTSTKFEIFIKGSLPKKRIEKGITLEVSSFRSVIKRNLVNNIVITNYHMNGDRETKVLHFSKKKVTV